MKLLSTLQLAALTLSTVLPSLGAARSFNALPLEEMRLYYRMGRAMQAGYGIQEYAPAPKDGPFGKSRNNADDLRFISYEYQSPQGQAYDASVWTISNPASPSGKTTCFIFHGSSQFGDWITDISTGIEGIMSVSSPERTRDDAISIYQLTRASKIINDRLDEYYKDRSAPPYIIGHSLGGGMAQAAYLALDEQYKDARVLAINPMGLPASYMKPYNDTSNPNVTIIINGHELVQYLNKMSGLSHISDRVYTLPTSPFSYLSLLAGTTGKLGKLGKLGLACYEHTIGDALAKMHMMIVAKEMLIRPVQHPIRPTQISDQEGYNFLLKEFLPAYERAVNTMDKMRDAATAQQHLGKLQEQVAEIKRMSNYVQTHAIKTDNENKAMGFLAEAAMVDMRGRVARQVNRLKAAEYFGNPALKGLINEL